MCIRDRVHRDQHGRVVEAQTARGVDELLVQALAGLGVLLVLKVLPDKALDHADSRDILLQDVYKRQFQPRLRSTRRAVMAVAAFRG